MISRYFSGFSLVNEKTLFSDYLIENDFTVSGFSYGSIQAFEAVYATKKRVDLLQLFSPAFFQDKDKKYKRMQLMFFKKDSTAYCENFLKNIALPSSLDMQTYFKQGSYEELETLLIYEWDKEKLQELVNRGIQIEVYLGSDDKIIDATKAHEFFKEFATSYYIKNAGHILKISKDYNE